MEVRYNVTGKDRKRMAEIIGKVIGVDAIYKGAPSFAYEIDQFTITKEGTLIFNEHIDEYETEAVLTRLDYEGFEAEEPEESGRLTITVAAGLDGDAISRLEALIESKESLLKKAIGMDNLRIECKGDDISFPWFKTDVTDDERIAYMQLCSALCLMAKKAKRVNGHDHEVENEKYAFRCFLLRLGLIGDEYKTSRKVLLQNFTGSSAFRNGGKRDEISE
ncbi:MAG: virulence protein [Firmicutes bacterium]|nr:virulence protein [Bacillota bacterium]